MPLDLARQMLESGSYTCVLTDGRKYWTSESRGVKPLVEFLQNDTPKGLYAADKVVGRATAFLYVLLGIDSLYAKVISRPAIDVLTSNKIKVGYETAVDNIINRKKDGICPFEEVTLNITEPKEAYVAILKKLGEISDNTKSSKG